MVSRQDTQAVVLLSGGLDSSACAHFLQQRGLRLRGLFIDHGQAAARREATASAALASHLGIPLEACVLSNRCRIGAGELVGRNAMLIFNALFLTQGKTDLLALGVHAGVPYFDCSETFFRESVVRRIFDHISLCFCDWDSAAAIVASYPACHLAAQASFRATTKLSAIVEIARRVDAMGFDILKRALMTDPITTMRQFPYIGPIAVWHLAKNLGFDVSKPDRHLVRIAKRLGFSSPEQFCEAIADSSGEAVKVIDLVIWRYLQTMALRLLRE